MKVRLILGASLRSFLLMLCVFSFHSTGRAAEVTMSFDFDGFTTIAVFAPYKVIATQGSNFLVQVIVDEEDTDAINVSKSGPTLFLDLNSGNHHFDTLEVRVAMPTLNGMKIVGTSDVSLSGFDQKEMTVEIIGTGHVSGHLMRLDDLSVNVIGTGAVDFGEIDPVQTAHVDFDGVIEAALNMDVGSALTGRMTGVSKLRYWGTNVDLQVVTSGSAEIERLGGTRPARTPDGFRINSGLSDAWYNPDTSGQGFTIIVWENIQKIFLTWFTFDTLRPPEEAKAVLGEPGHRWVTALGPYRDDSATLDIYLSSGGVFDSPLPAVNPEEKIGVLTLVWNNCNEGRVTYDMPALGLMGEIPIRRIVLDNVSRCVLSQ